MQSVSGIHLAMHVLLHVVAVQQDGDPLYRSNYSSPRLHICRLFHLANQRPRQWPLAYRAPARQESSVCRGSSPRQPSDSPAASRRKHALLRRLPRIASICSDAVIGDLARRIGICCHPPAVSGRRMVCTGRLSPSTLRYFGTHTFPPPSPRTLPSHALLSNSAQWLELVRSVERSAVWRWHRPVRAPTSAGVSHPKFGARMPPCPLRLLERFGCTPQAMPVGSSFSRLSWIVQQSHESSA